MIDKKNMHVICIRYQTPGKAIQTGAKHKLHHHRS